MAFIAIKIEWDGRLARQSVPKMTGETPVPLSLRSLQSKLRLVHWPGERQRFEP